MNGVALCAGVGGLELGVRLACPGYRTVCYVEREAYAAATLVARMEDEALDRAPTWDDLATFDGKPWRGVVDCITAGIPCQPYSFAGQRKGHEDERALWPELVRIVSECLPTLVFIENVPAFLGYFRPIGEELCRLGYEIADPVFVAAEDLGAPHRRERVFILAHRDLDGQQGEWCRGLFDGVGEAQWNDADRCSEVLPGWYSAFPPGPADDWAGVPEEAQPAIRGVAGGMAHRVDRLRATGNGVVPLVAAAAFRTLATIP